MRSKRHSHTSAFVWSKLRPGDSSFLRWPVLAFHTLRMCQIRLRVLAEKCNRMESSRGLVSAKVCSAHPGDETYHPRARSRLFPGSRKTSLDSRRRAVDGTVLPLGTWTQRYTLVLMIAWCNLRPSTIPLGRVLVKTDERTESR